MSSIISAMTSFGLRYQHTTSCPSACCAWGHSTEIQASRRVRLGGNPAPPNCATIPAHSMTNAHQYMTNYAKSMTVVMQFMTTFVHHMMQILQLATFVY